MGLEEVVAEISKMAKIDAEAILREGKNLASEILKTAAKEIEEKKALAERDVEDVKAASEKREMASVQLNAKKQAQDVKKELLGAAYDGLKRKAAGLSEKEREKVLATLFEKSRREIGEIGTVYVSKQDMKIALALFRAKNVAVKEKSILGGIVAESADARIMADYSFDMIIESMKERMLKDVSRILF